MDTTSRTAKSIKNSVIAIGFYFVRLILQFFSRKIFLEYLGTEVLGLNTTAMNLLEFLNLVELGIGPAISFTLYKPIRERDYSKLNEIISLQGHLFKRIGLIILVGAALLMLFFPLIFSKMNLPLWYAYGSFSVLLLSSLLGYFVNYKQILLSANQQTYKITYSFGTATLVKILIQIVALSQLPDPYIWWLVIEGLFAIIGAIVLNTMTRRTFPFLKNSDLTFSQLSKKYEIIIIKIKQLIFHKIGGFVLTQTSPLIIYAFLSLTTVALYGNYLILITGVTSLFNSMFSSVTASIGDLVSEGNQQKILDVFGELFSIRFYFICILCFGIVVYSSPFISIWIGPEYILSNITIILMTANMYIGLSRSTVDAYLYVTGQFDDIWSPIAEAILNLGLSILFGYFWGLNGILLGVFTSLFIIIFLWKPIFLFHWGFKISYWNYVKLYVKHLIAILFPLTIFASMNLLSKCTVVESWKQLFISATIGISIFAVLLFISMLLLKCPFYKSFQRIVGAI